MFRHKLSTLRLGIIAYSCGRPQLSSSICFFLADYMRYTPCATKESLPVNLLELCKALVGCTRITEMSPAPGLSSGTAEIAAMPALQMLRPSVETQNAWASSQRLDQAWVLSSVWVVHRLLLACSTTPMRHKHQGSPVPAGHV